MGSPICIRGRRDYSCYVAALLAIVGAVNGIAAVNWSTPTSFASFAVTNTTLLTRNASNIAVVCQGTNTNCVALATVSGGNLNWNSPSNFHIGTLGLLEASGLDTNNGVAAFMEGAAGPCRAMAFDMSGGTLTFGTKEQFLAGAADTISTVPISSNRFVLVYGDQAGTRGVALLCAVTNNKVSFGPTHGFGSDRIYDASLAMLESNRVVLAYRDSGDSHRGKSFVGVIAGDTISMGPTQTFDLARSERMSVTAMDTNRFVIFYRDQPADNGEVIVGETSSDTNIAFGASVSVFNQCDSLAAVALSTGQVALVYNEGADGLHGKSVLAGVVGNTIAWSGTNILSTNAVTAISPTRLQSDQLAVVFSRGAAGRNSFGALDHYVTLDGGHSGRYETWANAATGLPPAVAYALPGSKVYVSNGVHKIGGGIDTNSELIINGMSVTNGLLSSNVLVTVGNIGSGNRLIITNQGCLYHLTGYMGCNAGSDTNTALITGSNSTWETRFDMFIGNAGCGNAVVISNEACVVNDCSYIGYTHNAKSNSVVIDGYGSGWLSDTELVIGANGSHNTMTLANGAVMQADWLSIGAATGAEHNVLAVEGTNSLAFVGPTTVGETGSWNRLEMNALSESLSFDMVIGEEPGADHNSFLATGMSEWTVLDMLAVGYAGAANSVILTNFGAVAAGGIVVGLEASSSNNFIYVGSNSYLYADDLYEIIRGTNIVDGGDLDVGMLIMTNSDGALIFNSGYSYSLAATVDNGQPFVVGDGVGIASNEVYWDGAPGHVYSDGLIINTNATLAGDAVIAGTVTMRRNSWILPGDELGPISISNLTFEDGSHYIFQAKSNLTDFIMVSNVLQAGSAGSTVTVSIVDKGGADFSATNTIITYGAMGIAPVWAIDYGTNTVVNLRITTNTALQAIVMHPNHACSFSSTPLTNATVESLYSYTVGTDDPDGDVPAMTAPTLPTWLSLETGSGTNILYGTPDNTSTGVYAVLLEITDGASTAQQSFAIAVTATTPTVTTETATAISSTNATCAGTITSDGGAPVTARGLCWGTNSTPTISGTCCTNGSGMGAFTNTATDLSPDTTYYLRAYAINEKGVSYGNQVSFSTTARLGTLTIDITPDSGEWSISSHPTGYAGITNGTGDLASTNISIGSYTIAFGRIARYTEPPDQTVEISDGGSATVTAIYTPLYARGDYNGDGIADIIVYNRASGNWYIRSISGEAALYGENWGGQEYVPVPGDYNGDGTGDLCVYNTSQGTWYARSLSGINIMFGVNWGGEGYIPVPGDYDGDGTSDMAVYDPVSGNWYIQTVSGTNLLYSENWGGTTLMPVPGDYNGDRASDMAVYDFATGNWYIRTVSGTTLVYGMNWGGGPGFMPLSGDFDGDGRDDLVVYEQSTGYWYILCLENQSEISNLRYQIAPVAQWGGATYVPIAGDYDGDAVDDLAVYDTVTGEWYIRTLSGTVISYDEQWGGTGFLPAMETDAVHPSDLAPMFRLYLGRPVYEHVYTASIEEETALVGNTWTYEGVAWYGLSSRLGSAVPLYRVYAQALRRHRYTTSSAEYENWQSQGWVAEGVQDYVWLVLGNDRIPVYRFYNAATATHLYTADPAEAATLQSHPEWDWACEGITFYVYGNP